MISRINPLKMFAYGYGFGHNKFTLHLSSQKRATFMSLIGSPAKLDKRLKNIVDADVELDFEELVALEKEIKKGIRLFKMRAALPAAVLLPDVDHA